MFKAELERSLRAVNIAQEQLDSLIDSNKETLIRVAVDTRDFIRNIHENNFGETVFNPVTGKWEVK